MENQAKRANDIMEDSCTNVLSDREKEHLSERIVQSLIALTCLVTGLCFKTLFPSQTVVLGFIYSIGILVTGVPMLFNAIRGFMKVNVENSIEILTVIAMLACYITVQHELAILIPIILNAVHFLEERSIMGGRDAVEGLKQMQASTAILETEGGEQTVEIEILKVGDVVLVRPGMAMPVDGTVIWGNSNIDQKSLTGESLPVTVQEGDPVYAGTTNLDGLLRVRVEKEFSDTSFTKIVALLEEAQKIVLPETRIIDRFMHYYIPFALTVAALTALLSQNIDYAIAVLVVSCPCGHVLVSSAPMIATLAVATKRGILIKNSKFVEKLTDISSVVFDKTGTITEGKLSVSGCFLQEGESQEQLLELGARVACNSLHPISTSLMTAQGDRAYETGYNILEIVGGGLVGTKGDDEVLFGSGRFIESKGYHPQPFEAEEGAGPANWVVYNGRVMGCLTFDDTVRQESAEVIELLHRQGEIEAILLTGDRKSAANRVQNEVGIDRVYCELLPQEKQEHVRSLRENGQVLVVGDGINDALALAEADVGIAMGAMGADVAIQSADIALMNNDLYNIPFTIMLARETKSIIYQNIGIAFFISFVMILLAAVGIVPPLAGALLHNMGAFIILFNSARILHIEERISLVAEEQPEEMTETELNDIESVEVLESEEIEII